jgi:hypothetical protein
MVPNRRHSLILNMPAWELDPSPTLDCGVSAESSRRGQRKGSSCRIGPGDNLCL